MECRPVNCDVWWARPQAARPALGRLLDAEERARHARLRKASDRDRYLVAHALARLACAQSAGCGPEEVEFTRHCPRCEGAEPHGKPVPGGAARGLQMSLTHSGDLVGVALAREAPVGLDAERISERGEDDLAALAAYVLGETEYAQWCALAPRERHAGFVTYWARKEALLKATGAGLGGGLSAVQVTAPHEPAAVVGWQRPDAPRRVHLSDLDVGGGHRAALALLCGGPVHVVRRDAETLLGAVCA